MSGIVNVDKQAILEEVLVEVEARINYSLLETRYDEREDLKQDIIIRLVEAVDKMAIITLSDFERDYLDNNI